MTRRIVAAFALVVVFHGTHPEAQAPIAQTQPGSAPIEVTWHSVRDSVGNTHIVPVLAISRGTDSFPVDLQTAQRVIHVDEEYRLAKLQNDVPTISRILSDDYFGINQNGSRRDKAAALELWRSFPISSLVTDTASIRLAGSIATVTGEQTEVNGTGMDRMLFMRVYTQTPSGDWRLVSSMQSRNPLVQMRAERQ